MSTVVIVMDDIFCKASLLLATVLVAASGATAQVAVEVTWLGHAAVRLVAPDGRSIVIDPYLQLNPQTPPEWRNLERLADTNLILLTHGHIDHIADLVPLSRMSGAKVIGPYEIMRTLVRLGRLDAEQNVSLGKGGYAEPIGRGIRIHMVTAEHSSSIDLMADSFTASDDFLFRHVEGGEPVGYVVEFEDGPTIYHAGDTAVFGDMQLIGELLEPDLALLPIGGTFTMGPKGAAYAAGELLGVPEVIPIHYDTFPIISRSPEEFEAALAPWPVRMISLDPGETYTAAD